MVAPVTSERKTKTHPSSNGEPEPSPLDGITEEFVALRRLASRYLATRRDAVAAGIRQTALKIVLAVAVAIPIVTMLIAAAVQAVTGLANAIAVALGDRIWAGQLIVGWGLVTIAVAGAFFVTSSWRRAARQRTIDKYEQQHPRT